MNKNQTTVKFQLDVCSDNFSSPWETVASLLNHLDNPFEVVSLKLLSDVGMWPSFIVETRTEESARAVVAKYLGLDPSHRDVTEYLEEGVPD